MFLYPAFQLWPQRVRNVVMCQGPLKPKGCVSAKAASLQKLLPSSTVLQGYRNFHNARGKGYDWVKIQLGSSSTAICCRHGLPRKEVIVLHSSLTEHTQPLH